MLTRILETLSSYNDRQRREHDTRTAERERDRERQARVDASGQPTGIACPVCHHELGDTGNSRHIGLDPMSEDEFPSSHEVLCANCGFRGVRDVYTPRKRGL